MTGASIFHPVLDFSLCDIEEGKSSKHTFATGHECNSDEIDFFKLINIDVYDLSTTKTHA